MTNLEIVIVRRQQDLQKIMVRGRVKVIIMAEMILQHVGYVNFTI